MYFAASIATCVVIIILWLIKPVERKLFRRYRMHAIRLLTEQGTGFDQLAEINDILSAEKAVFSRVSIEKKGASSVIDLRFNNIGETTQIITLVNKFQTMPGIKEVTWDKMN